MKRTHRLPHFGVLFFSICLLILAGACSPLSELRHANEAPPDVSGFRIALAQEYAYFAESESELGHVSTRDHFARKGLAALRGVDVPPETLEDKMLEEADLLELQQARGRLLGLRTEFLESVVSQNLARAQIFYDCWVMQTVSGKENDLSTPCHQSFLEEVGLIEQLIKTLGPKPQMELPVEFTVLFGTGKSNLSRDGEYAIEQALAAKTLFPNAKLEVTGHADRTGSKKRNMELSQARADTVGIALQAVGIPAEDIMVNAVGEDDLATPTLDGIARERNRRVTIWITNPAPATEEMPEAEETETETILEEDEVAVEEDETP